MIPLNPVAYLRFATRVLANSWRHRKAASIGLIQQTREIAALLHLNRLEPYEYYEYELHDGSLTWKEKTRFMSHHQASRFYTGVNHYFERGALNKLIAHVMFRHIGLPTSELYGVFGRNGGWTAEGKPLRTLDHLRDFVNDAHFERCIIKPVSSQRGFGVKLLRVMRGAPCEIEDVGVGKTTVEELYETMVSTRHNLNEAPYDTYLFEEFIRQHPFLDQFADSCTQCLRIITYITMTGEVEVLNTNIKLGQQGNVFDNTREEGISAGIGPDGVMAAGIAYRGGRRIEFERHPDSGAPIKGVAIPRFAEAVDLARRAQSLFPQVRSIGWDIAVTEAGPVIIEGNFTWSRHTQQYTRVGLITDAVRRELEMIV